jgi:hypothetical protein
MSNLRNQAQLPSEVPAMAANESPADTNCCFKFLGVTNNPGSHKPTIGSSGNREKPFVNPFVGDVMLFFVLPLTSS